MQNFKNGLGWLLLLGIGYNIGFWTCEFKHNQNNRPMQQQNIQPDHTIQLPESPGLKVTWI